MTTNNTGDKDNDMMKGAVEDEAPDEKAMTSMSGQLGHRDEDPLLKDHDSDFPEPGESPEHSGESKDPDRKDGDTRFVGGKNEKPRGLGDQPRKNELDPEAVLGTQKVDPKQKGKQNDKQDDDLAA